MKACCSLAEENYIGPLLNPLSLLKSGFLFRGTVEAKERQIFLGRL